MQATRRPTATSEKGVRGCVVQRVKVWGAGRERGGDFKAECVLHGCNGRCERDRINCFSPARHHPFFRGLIEEQSFNFAEFTPPACIDRSSPIEWAAGFKKKEDLLFSLSLSLFRPCLTNKRLSLFFFSLLSPSISLYIPLYHTQLDRGHTNERF